MKNQYMMIAKHCMIHNVIQCYTVLCDITYLPMKLKCRSSLLKLYNASRLSGSEPEMPRLLSTRPRTYGIIRYNTVRYGKMLLEKKLHKQR